jgi:hypothetical protein
MPATLWDLTLCGVQKWRASFDIPALNRLENLTLSKGIADYNDDQEPDPALPIGLVISPTKFPWLRGLGVWNIQVLGANALLPEKFTAPRISRGRISRSQICRSVLLVLLLLASGGLFWPDAWTASRPLQITRRTLRIWPNLQRSKQGMLHYKLLKKVAKAMGTKLNFLLDSRDAEEEIPI